MSFLVLEDRPHNSAVVHRVGCHSATEQERKTRRYAEWHGPFGSESIAFAAAKRTRLSSIRSCGCCYR